MKNLFIYLAKPFNDYLLFFLLFFLLTSVADVYLWIDRQFYYYALYIIAHNFLMSYIITLPLVWINYNILFNLYKSIILTIAGIIFILNSFCVLILHNQRYEDILIIIAGTNINEAIEYLESSISINNVFAIIFFLTLIFLFCYFVKLIKNHTDNKLKFAGLSYVLIFLVMVIHNPLAYNDALLGELHTLIQTFTQIQKSPDLRRYLSNPSLISILKQHPDNVVMIIGESFNKSHSSLYGYNKETNPLLSELKDKELLFVFDSIRSVTTNTIESFQVIMSTYKPEYKDSCNWYECTTLPEIVKLSGYNTFWVSNQSKVGLFDNVVGRYSELCDTSAFVGDKYAGMRRTNLDEEIFDLLSPLVINNNSVHNNFYVIHLMGSHADFKKRYPANFNRFDVQQYLDFPRNQRTVLAEYDNSILYNDSIVYELMNLYSNKEAIVFYFSDHSIDLFDSSKYYCGHARKTDSLSVKAGTNIPFMIYASPKYQEKFKDKMELIKKNLHAQYTTDNIIYTIMDIIGVDFKDDLKVKNNSLLSK